MRFEELHAESVGVGEHAVDEERRDGLLDGVLHALAARSGGVPDQAVIGRDADDHGVAFEDGALAAEEGQPEGSANGYDSRWERTLAIFISATVAQARRLALQRARNAHRMRFAPGVRGRARRLYRA